MSISEQFYTRISDEHNEFINNLKSKNVDEILEAAYEKTLKEEIINTLENNYYGDEEYIVLLGHNGFVEEVYRTWLDSDSTDLAVIDELINDIIERDGQDLENTFVEASA